MYVSENLATKYCTGGNNISVHSLFFPIMDKKMYILAIIQLEVV